MNNDICLGCMSKKGSEAECPKCGYIEGTPQILPALTPGTVIADRYLVGKKISSNGEGIVYIALDRESGRKVTLHEYLPVTLCTRITGDDAIKVNPGAEGAYDDYREDFLEIHKAVARISNIPAIVPVLDIFECNNTVYAVYENVAGKPLTEIIRRAKRLTWDEARPIFLPLISAMISAHSIGLVHFGINPDCVYMTHDGRLVITGFGIPDARFSETELAPELYDGYSAIEQYALEGERGKWSDVYSLSAVIYFCLTGKRPPDSVSRAYDPRLKIPTELADVIPAHVVTALSGGLQVQPEKRTPGFEELKNELSLRAPSRSRDDGAQRAPYQKTPAPAGANRNAAKKSGPWYENLSQLQYGLLAAGITLVTLGLLVWIVWPGVKNAIETSLPNHSSGSTTVVISGGDISESDVETCVVPSFVNKVWTDVRTDPNYQMFALIQLPESYSDNYPEGVIISQNVAEGTVVEVGTPIGITVSLGPKMRTIPNIIGMSVAEADTALTGSGLILGDQLEQYSDSVPSGRIISLSGSAVGNKIAAGSAVNVVVSLGPNPLGN
ncbi:MAG: PASTA domain-containing protein [Ruminococcaceae bacterium]|nr:PASTA domain-containing protein [Oscillospiraceae bacterium]